LPDYRHAILGYVHRAGVVDQVVKIGRREGQAPVLGGHLHMGGCRQRRARRQDRLNYLEGLPLTFWLWW